MPRPTALVALVLAFAATAATAQSASLSVTKNADVATAAPGDPVTFTLVVGNEGPDDALAVDLADALPPELLFQSLASPAGWSCTTPAVGTSGTVDCTLADFPPGSAVFTVVATVAPATTAGTVLSNQATVTSTTADPDSSDNEATADVTVTAAAGGALTLTKTGAPDPLVAGSDLTYTLTANHSFDHDVKEGTITDPLPPGTTFVSLTAAGGWACTSPPVGTAGTVTCSRSLWPSGAADFTLVVHVPLAAGPSALSNTATLDIVDNGRPSGSVSATATTAILSPAALDATKAVAGTFSPGGTVTYTIVLHNASANGQADNPRDELSDTLPAGLTLVSASADSGVAAVAGNTATWNGAIPGGGSVTITLQATLGQLPPGTVVPNQAAIAYDADGDGTNEASGVSDDPAVGGADDPTAFTVVAAPVIEVPTLGGWGLVALGLLLAVAGWRRRRAEAR